MSTSRMRRVELHTHSTASDGDFEPEKVAELCDRAGVEVWALTDHDTIAGCAEARRAAERRDIEFICGIEISAYLERSIHVLGYGVDHDATTLRDLSAKLRAAREERMRDMLRRLAEVGLEPAIAFSEVEKIADGAPLSRAHLADAMVRSGAVSDVDEAFDDWIGADAPGYVPVGWPTVPETIERIHTAGGAAVLAHPGRYDVDDHLPTWVDAGLDGIEVVHPRHDEADAARYRAFATEHDLVATASSDFHGWDHVSGDHFGEIRMKIEHLRTLRDAIEAQR